MRKLFVMLGMLFAFTLPCVAAAYDVENTGLYETGGAAFGDDATNGENSSLSYFIGNNLIKPVFGIVGTLFFGLTVYAGVLWMTAQGDPKKVDSAKNILVAAVIGTVIVVSAYVITNAVFSGITTGTVS